MRDLTVERNSTA